jgi:hypothetical protein
LRPDEWTILKLRPIVSLSARPRIVERPLPENKVRGTPASEIIAASAKFQRDRSAGIPIHPVDLAHD